MSTNNSKKATINQVILRTVRTKKPKTVEQLVSLVGQEHPTPPQEILERILQLQKNGKLVLAKDASLLPATLTEYLLSTQAAWYWGVIVTSFLTTIAVFTIPVNAYPLVYVRYLLGALFVLLLPGYSLVKALFPARELTNIERTALSIGGSLALVPLTGIILNYTPWGIRVTPLTLSLLTLTAIVATTALFRGRPKQV